MCCPESLREKFDGHLLDGGQRVRVIDVIKDPKARKDELKHANVFIQVALLYAAWIRNSGKRSKEDTVCFCRTYPSASKSLSWRNICLNGATLFPPRSLRQGLERTAPWHMCSLDHRLQLMPSFSKRDVG